MDQLAAGCGGLDDDHSMALCKCCQQGCHLACHDSPLPASPADGEEWLCPKCRHVRAATHVRDSFRSAQARAGVSEEDMLDATASLLSGEAANTAVILDADEPGPSAAVGGVEDTAGAFGKRVPRRSRHGTQARSRRCLRRRCGWRLGRQGRRTPR
jgi:PHD-finger